MNNEIDATYIPIHVTADKLREAVEGLKNLGCQGWNVTVPHKSAIIPFLDQLDPSARTNECSKYSPSTSRMAHSSVPIRMVKGFVRSLGRSLW